MKIYNETAENVILKLGGSGNGLTEAEVKRSRKKYGANVITKTKSRTIFKRITDALSEPMLIILEIAAAITLGVNIGKALKSGNGDFYECIGILAAILISVVLTVVMEGKSQKAFELLNNFYDFEAVKVLRNGNVEAISQKDIVVGDVVYLGTGDRIVADGRLITSTTLETDESSLTGESKPVKKFAGVVLPEKTPLAERKNCVYGGTFVTSGSGTMVVTAVGDGAEIGVIASELQSGGSVSAPLQEKLDKLGKTVAVLGAIASALVLIITVARLFASGNVSFDTIEEAFLSSIILIVASVPEGLPTTVAVALTLNVVKLYKSNALIKKLVAAETVGCVSVICSDKTGTLTENKMKVLSVSVYGGEKTEREKKRLIALNSAINSTTDLTRGRGAGFIGQATEAALIGYVPSLIGGARYTEIRRGAEIVDRTPFSSDKKFMSTTVKEKNGEVTYYKGAPEIILEKCGVSFSEKLTELKKISEEQEMSRRVIAFAHENGPSGYGKIEYDGFAVIADAVRKDVFLSVEECKKAGIDVKMLTGDNAGTAFSVAKELKICSSRGQVKNAEEVDKLSDEELKSALGDIKVVARSTPKTKLRIVKLLKELGEVVAVTGDGVNDAPAIKHADIGIAMGGGSDVTKEASDIVLLDNSFSTIVTAISFGRNIYENFQRFIAFQLSVNLTAVLFIIASLTVGFENPFTTLQLLWLNVVMDGPPALTLSLENRGYELMTRKPVKRSNAIVTKKMILRIVVQATLMCALLLLQYFFNYIGCKKSENATVIFNLFMTLNLFNAFNCRELGSKSAFASLKSNKIMPVVFAVTFVIQFVLTQFCGNFFGTVALSGGLWLKIVLTASCVVILSEIPKAVYRFFKNRKNKPETYKISLIKTGNNA